MDENFTLEDLKNGAPHAFEALYEQYYQMIASFIKKNNGSENDAEDIFQEALFALVKNVRKKDFKLTSKISTYLFSIARLKWFYKLRSQKNKIEVELDNAPESFMELDDELVKETIYEKKHWLMREVFKELKEDCQELITSFYIQGKPLSEIAIKRGWTNAYVKLKKSRCMGYFRNKIKNHPNFKDLKN